MFYQPKLNNLKHKRKFSIKYDALNKTMLPKRTIGYYTKIAQTPQTHFNVLKSVIHSP